MLRADLIGTTSNLTAELQGEHGLYLEGIPVDGGILKYDAATKRVYVVAIDDAMSDTSENVVQNKVIKQYVDQNSGTITTISVNGVQQEIVNKNVNISVPAATSGLINDGDGESPFATEEYVNINVPTVNDSTITVQKNGTTVDSFTLNQSSDKSINITVPTQASDVHALPDSTKYGASLSVNGTSVQLKDQDGNNLGDAITTQDTDTGATSVEVTGAGNAVTDASYSASNRKMTLTKGATYTTASDVGTLISGKQDAANNTNLTTTDKTVVGAINEVNSLAKGRVYTKEYDTISDMVTALNAMSATELKAGDNVYIVATGVPDLWVGKVESSATTYTYTTDDDFVNAITGSLSTTVQVGYYRLCELETEKVDLSNVVDSNSTVTPSGNGNVVTNLSIDSSGNITLTKDKTAVETSRTIAGVDLADNITKSELLTALNVGDGAEVNAINSISVDNTSVAPDANKNVNIDISGKYVAKADNPVEYGTGKDSVKNKTPYDETDVDSHGNVIDRTNTVAGNFSATFGSRNNIGSGSSETFVTGGKNTVTHTEDASISGYENTVSSSHQSLIGGYDNDVKASESIVVGESNTIDGTITGTGYKTNTRSMAVFGNGNAIGIDNKYSLIVGQDNEMGISGKWNLMAGAHNDIGRNNECINVLGWTNKTNGYLTDSTLAGYDNIALGGASGDNAFSVYMLGHSNNNQNPSDANKGLSEIYQIGHGLRAKHRGQVVLGKYNLASVVESNDILTVGCGNADNQRADCFGTGNDGTNHYIRVGTTKFTESGLSNLKDNAITDFEVDGVSFSSGNSAEIKTINGDYDGLHNKLATSNDIGSVIEIAEGKMDKTLTGSGAPTTSTVGFIGQTYKDITNDVLYICDAITTENDVTTYIWTQLIRATDLPTVNDGILTIQKEGTTLDTFTANSSSNKTINIVESDPVFSASAASGISNTDISNWNNKVDKTSSVNKVYGTDSNGDQTTYNVANASNVGGAIAKYDSSGRLKSATPSQSDDAANKGYVDGVISNPNLLINGDFRVNQRGASSYTANNKYTVDRWMLQEEIGSGGVVSVNNDNTITLTTTAANFLTLSQYIEDYNELLGKKVTLSVSHSNGVITTTTGTLPTSWPNTDAAYFTVEGTTYILELYYSATGSLEFCFTAKPNQAITIKYCKLEIGDVATSFYPRSTAEELALCQRYYQVPIESGKNMVTCGFLTTGGLAYYMQIPLTTPLRTSPTLETTPKYRAKTSTGNSVHTGSSFVDFTTRSVYTYGGGTTVTIYDTIAVMEETANNIVLTYEVQNVAFDAEIY